MGYYTCYNMDVKGLASLDDFVTLNALLNGRDLFDSVFMTPDYSDFHEDGSAEYFSSNMAKWYEHDDDMTEISKLLPNATFKLCGVGEAEDDKWYTLYKDGKSDTVIAQIVWPKSDVIEWNE